MTFALEQRVYQGTLTFDGVQPLPAALQTALGKLQLSYPDSVVTEASLRASGDAAIINQINVMGADALSALAHSGVTSSVQNIGDLPSGLALNVVYGVRTDFSSTGATGSASVLISGAGGGGLTYWLNVAGGWQRVTKPINPASGIVTVDNLADIQALTNLNTQNLIYSRSKTLPGDGGHGEFYFDPADTTSADDGGTTLVATGGKRYKRLFGASVDPRWWNAKSDSKSAVGTISSGTNILNASTSVFSSADTGKRIIVFGAGTASTPLEAVMTYVSATQVTLSVSAVVTATAQAIWWGTDNRAAMQAAIAASVDTGAAVEIPRYASFDIYGELNLANNVRFKGNHRGILRQLKNNSNLIKGNSISNVVIENLTLIGLGITDSCAYGYYTGFEARGISIANSDGVVIQNNAVIGFKNAGIVSWATSNVRILSNNVTGITPTDGQNHSFGIHVGANTQADGRDSVLVFGNTIRDTSQALFFGPGYTGVRIIGNHINGTAQHGMYLYSHRNFVIEGNQVVNAFYDGIKCQNIETTTINPNNITLIGNTIINCRGSAWGIIVDMQVVTGNKRTFFENVVISNNTIADFTGGGIYTGSVRGFKINNNNVKRMVGSYGIYCVDGIGEINDNDVDTTTWGGIVVRPVSYGLITIRDNTCTNTATDGANTGLGTGQRVPLYAAGAFASSAGNGSAHPWTATSFYTNSIYVTSSGQVYKNVAPSGGTTSSTAPSHGSGTVADGTASWQWMSTTANLDAGEVHFHDNTVVVGDTGLPQYSLAIESTANPLRFGWNGNIFPLVNRAGTQLNVLATNQLVQFQGFNMYGGYAANPVYSGMVPGNFGREFSNTTTPSAGTVHIAGDRIWNRAITPGGVLLWACVTIGNPGTWDYIRVPLRGTISILTGTNQSVASNANLLTTHNIAITPTNAEAGKKQIYITKASGSFTIFIGDGVNVTSGASYDWIAQ